ncbi:MAG: hypothetical protein KatS3mg016_0881 [Fimbriimonadales bacterium]|nr:MAG: hypothetical protein KatS3mg016_0881 [Fimbriimonadales bacterium]
MSAISTRLTLPDYVAIADFSLKGKDPVVGALDRAVSYSWGQYRRFLNESELKKLFAEQFPAPPQKRVEWVTHAPHLRSPSIDNCDWSLVVLENTKK